MNKTIKIEFIDGKQLMFSTNLSSVTKISIEEATKIEKWFVNEDNLVLNVATQKRGNFLINKSTIKYMNID